MVDPAILNLTAHLEEPMDPDALSEIRQVVVIKAGGHEILRAEAPTYIDTFGDGGADLGEAAAMLLARRLSGGFSHG